MPAVPVAAISPQAFDDQEAEELSRCSERGEIGGRRRFEVRRPAVGRMQERQPMRVQRLALELDGAQRVGTVDVALLADERVPAQPGLDADLVAAAGLQPHFDQRRSTRSSRARGSR